MNNTEKESDYFEISNKFSEISPIRSSEKGQSKEMLEIKKPIKMNSVNLDMTERGRMIAKNFQNLEKFDKQSILLIDNFESAIVDDSFFDLNAPEKKEKVNVAGDSLVHQKRKERLDSIIYDQQDSSNLLEHQKDISGSQKDIIEILTLQNNLSSNVSSIHTTELKHCQNQKEINDILEDINHPGDHKVSGPLNHSCEISLRSSWEPNSRKEKEEITQIRENDESILLEQDISNNMNIMILENVSLDEDLDHIQLEIDPKPQNLQKEEENKTGFEDVIIKKDTSECLYNQNHSKIGIFIKMSF